LRKGSDPLPCLVSHLDTPVSHRGMPAVAGGPRPLATVRLGCNHGIHGMHGRDLGEGGFFTLRHGDTELCF